MIKLSCRPRPFNLFLSPSKQLPRSSAQTRRLAHTMRPLTPADLNPAVLNVQYAVRGELAIKADELHNRLQSADHDLPFTRVISSNIGNPQQKGLDQPPITFPRQVCTQVLLLLVCRIGFSLGWICLALVKVADASVADFPLSHECCP